MFGSLGTPEILIIGLIVVLLFGVGKIGRMGKDLGTSVREFRRAIREDEEPAKAPAAPTPEYSVMVEPPAAAGQRVPQPAPGEAKPPAVF